MRLSGLMRLTTGRLVALAVVLSLVPLALLTYFSLSFAEDAVSREVEARVKATTDLSAEVVRQEMQTLAELVASYGERPSLVTSLIGRPYDRDAIRFHLRELRHAREGIALSFVTDPRGRLIDILPPTPEIVGKDFSFRDWYNGVTTTGRPYVSEAYETQASGGGNVVAASTLVRSESGEVVAILVAGYSLGHIQAFSDELARAQGVRLKVTDQRGHLIASPGGASERLVSRLGDVRVAAALSGRSGVMTLDTPDGRRLSGYAPVPEIGWTVTASVRSDTALAAVGKLRSAVLGIATLLGIVLLGGVALLARTLRARERVERVARRQVGINEAVLEATTDGIALVDLEGRIALANQAFERAVSDMLGAPARLVEDRRAMRDIAALIAERTTDPDRYREAFAPLAANPAFIGLDEYELAESGRSFQRYTAPVRDATGEQLGRILVLREVTAERDAERLKSELVATVSHELRTPLTGVLGFAELLTQQELDADTRKRYLGTIYGEAKRLTSLINDFLDVQRIEAGGFALSVEPLDVRDVVREHAEILGAQAGGHSLELDLPEDEPLLVAGDRERIAQVVVNLVSNAVKYSPNGGRVRVEAGRANGAVKVSVSDEGLGIPEEHQSRIFQKFFRIDSSDTREIGGTGLGLALSREIVEAHGGTMGFESVEHEGSTFWFTLPSGHSTRRRGRSYVLVVEDDAAAAEFLRECLTGDGHAVEAVATGEEALERVATDPPSAICLDMRLAGDLDGWDVLDRLKADADACDIPVIICSGRNGRDRAAAIGARDFLTKPVARERLVEAVRRVVPNRARILVADDEETVRRLVVETLATEGYDLREANDGEDALQKIAASRPDALILDLMMPRVDGFTVLERLQDDPELRLLPVIVLTARRLSPQERRILSERATALLEKSDYSAHELRRLVGSALEG